jgi:sarcosine oxidase delta subunit
VSYSSNSSQSNSVVVAQPLQIVAPERKIVSNHQQQQSSAVSIPDNSQIVPQYQKQEFNPNLYMPQNSAENSYNTNDQIQQGFLRYMMLRMNERGPQQQQYYHPQNQYHQQQQQTTPHHFQQQYQQSFNTPYSQKQDLHINQQYLHQHASSQMNHFLVQFHHKIHQVHSIIDIDTTQINESLDL